MFLLRQRGGELRAGLGERAGRGGQGGVLRHHRGARRFLALRARFNLSLIALQFHFLAHPAGNFRLSFGEFGSILA